MPRHGLRLQLALCPRQPWHQRDMFVDANLPQRLHDLLLKGRADPVCQILLDDGVREEVAEPLLAHRCTMDQKTSRQIPRKNPGQRMTAAAQVITAQAIQTAAMLPSLISRPGSRSSGGGGGSDIFKPRLV